MNGGAVVTRTPVGFYHEPEHYDLTIEGITRAGGTAAAPSEADLINVVDRSVVRTNVSFTDGTATVRVPPGTYAVMGVCRRTRRRCRSTRGHSSTGGSPRAAAR